MTKPNSDDKETLNPAISAAMKALRAAVPQAQSDPDRPVFHFLPPARWMNDIHGPLIYKGEYNVFYQHNPFGEKNYDQSVVDRMKWAGMHWGHARSRDLVSWEHMPVALAPSTEKGELSCWSGCAAIDGNGRPMLFYTAVFENETPYKIPFEQWAAIGDEKLIGWEKSADNPILSLKTHGATNFNIDWRDPFIFKADGRTFMIIGACGEAGTPIYETEDDSLTKWKYGGQLWDKSVECPNFISLGDKWVFISSPFDLVSYDVGTFDIEKLKFVPETDGTVDWGHFYGTSTVIDNQGRCILLGWIPGWDFDANRDGHGWNGCMALPRVLSLNKENRLIQEPAPELEKLRAPDKHFHDSAITIDNSSHTLEDASGDTLEIIIEFARGNATAFGLCVRRSHDGQRALTICCDIENKSLDVAGANIPLPSSATEESLSLRVFLDKSVMEVYVNGGEAVATRMMYPEPEDLGIEIFARGGGVEVTSIDIWEMLPAIPKPVP